MTFSFQKSPVAKKLKRLDYSEMCQKSNSMSFVINQRWWKLPHALSYLMLFKSFINTKFHVHALTVHGSSKNRRKESAAAVADERE